MATNEKKPVNEKTKPESTNSRDKTRTVNDLTQGAYLINGKMQDGVRVITYSFHEQPRPDFMHYGATSLTKIDSQNQEKIRNKFRELEKLLNVRFEETSTSEPNIAFYYGHGMPNNGGYASSDKESTREVVIRPDQFDHAATHEIGHALGLSHPDLNSDTQSASSVGGGRGGANKAYNTRYSVMSYNGSTTEFGPADIAALQHHYGPAKNDSPHETISSNQLPELIVSKKPVTLKVELNSSTSHIALPTTADIGLRTFMNSRLGLDTQIQNAIVADNVTYSTTLTGNELPNILKGGSGNDTITAKGEGDKLTGGKGSDRFTLASGSLKTIIADKAPEDIIVFSQDAKRAVVESAKNGHHGTIIKVYDGQDNLISPDSRTKCNTCGKSVLLWKNNMFTFPALRGMRYSAF